MPYGLTKEAWGSINSEIVRKIYMTPSAQRRVALVDFTEEELLEAVKEMHRLKKSKEKIKAITRELEERSQSFPPGSHRFTDRERLAFACEWKEMQGRFKGISPEILRRIILAPE